MGKRTYDKTKLDISQIFLVYMSLVGDSERTAAALELDPQLVAWLAEDEGWVDKIRRVNLLAKTGKPGEFERAQNRTLCFVQAHRLRLLLDKMMHRFAGLSPEEIADRLSSVDKGGNIHISARFFADLSSAMEKAHALSYQALGDTLGERDGRDNKGTEESATSIHLAVISALNNPSMQRVDSDLLVHEASEKVLANERERNSLPEQTPSAVP